MKTVKVPSNVAKALKLKVESDLGMHKQFASLTQYLTTQAENFVKLRGKIWKTKSALSEIDRNLKSKLVKKLGDTEDSLSKAQNDLEDFMVEINKVYNSYKTELEDNK